MEGNFKTEGSWNSLNVINTLKLTPDDILHFETISNEIEKNFTFLIMELKNEILLSLLQKLISLIKNHKTHKRENYGSGILYEVSLTTVSACKYVEISSNKYVAFPYWSFGSHSSEENKMLFGYLEIDPVYGFYMLSDNNYKLVCVVIIVDCKKTDTEISQLQNSYILIEKYTIMTEIFQESKVPNAEYIIAKVDDIHVIHSSNKSSNIFGMKSNKTEYPNVISFKLLKKSPVCARIGNLRELFLEVSIKFSSTGLVSGDVYLVLPSQYICLNLQLKEELSYMMYYKTSMTIVRKPELTRIKNLKIYEIPRECFFQPVSDETCALSKPLSTLECKSHIENSRDLITFRGIIKKKRFTDSLPSWTRKIPALYGFGTPGTKVHQIVFSYVDNNCTKFLDCYLNNWENMLMPLGLVPEMEVIVRHVIPQSKKYLKSTVFTSFEVVSYRPCSNFSTVNLYKNDDIDWGMPVLLSRGTKIPVDVLVWGRAYNIFMLKLSVRSQCIKCKQIFNPNHSNSCGGTEGEIQFEAKFNVWDPCGQSSVTAKSLDILQVLLNLNKDNFKEWAVIFNYIGPYSYNYFEKSTDVFEDFTTYLKKISEQNIFFDLKCRKVADSSSKANQRPAWYCIEARRG